MRDNNKRKREEEAYYMQNVNETHSYQGVSSSTAQNIQTPAIEQNQSFNQPLLLNQPIIQNQQLLYQIQRASDQQQNLVYLLVPTNENIQVQSVPLNVLPNEQLCSGQQYVVNTQANNHIREKNDTFTLHEGVKQETSTVKPEYYPESNLIARQNKGGSYSYSAPKPATVKPEVNNSYVTTYADYTKPTNTVLKDNANTSKPHLYRCDYKDCSVRFYSLYEKKLHLDTHIFPENSEFKCSICNMVFEKAVDRNKHVESHSIAPTYKCRQCEKEFTYYTILVKHIEEKKCSTKNPIPCYFCETKFFDNVDFIKHHQLTMKQCSCGARVCGNQAYELHMSLCGVFKSVDRNQGPFDRKRIKTKKT